MAPGMRGRLGTLDVLSAGMSPTLGVGDLAVVDRGAYAPGVPARGDVVVFRPTAGAAAACGIGTDTLFVKRVMGVAGDVVSAGPGGVTVNGAPIAIAGARPPLDARDFGAVPPGAVLVLGDLAPGSCDAAVWPDPFLPVANLRGRVAAVLAPRGHAGTLRPDGGVARRAHAGPLRGRLDALLAVADDARVLADAAGRRGRVAALVRAERARLARALRAVRGDCGERVLAGLRRALGTDLRGLADPRRPIARSDLAIAVHHARAHRALVACWGAAGARAAAILR